MTRWSEEAVAQTLANLIASQPARLGAGCHGTADKDMPNDKLLSSLQ